MPMCVAAPYSSINGCRSAANAQCQKGPPIWICGDCHVGNLGLLAAADGKIHVQIRDLDQSVIGNPNHDLIRLALSLSSAARGSDLRGEAAYLEHCRSYALRSDAQRYWMSPFLKA